MTAPRATNELRQGTGITWAQETDRRLKQWLGLPQADARTTAQLWDLVLRKKGFVLGSYASRMAAWLQTTGDKDLTETYAALRLTPYHGAGRD